VEEEERKPHYGKFDFHHSIMSSVWQKQLLLLPLVVQQQHTLVRLFAFFTIPNGMNETSDAFQ